MQIGDAVAALGTKGGVKADTLPTAGITSSISATGACGAVVEGTGGGTSAAGAMNGSGGIAGRIAGDGADGDEAGVGGVAGRVARASGDEYGDGAGGGVGRGTSLDPQCWGF